MVIRQLLDSVDREVKAHKDAVVRLETLRETILTCCRAEKKSRSKKENGRCHESETRRAA
jgi:hypothetical protein